MADAKVTGLTEDTSPISTDLLMEVDDPAGTPLSKKVTMANAITKAHGLSDGIVKVASSTMAPATDGTDYLSTLIADTTPQLGGRLDCNGSSINMDSATGITDDEERDYIVFQKAATAINYFTMDNSAAGNAVILGTSGSDAAVDMNMIFRGTGGLTLEGSSAKVNTILDEDAMGTDSATALATQQSIKAYADTKTSAASTDTFTNKTFDANGVGNSITNVDLTADITGTLPVANGGTGVTSSTGTGNTVLSTSPTFTTPVLGTPTSGVATNLTGTAAGLTAGAVSTITGLAPDTATTQATQASITTAANLTTVGTVTTGNVDAVVSASSVTVAGKIEVATVAETDTGTDAARATSPDAIAGSYAGTKSVQMVCFDFTTATATGDGKFYFHVPTALDGMNLVAVHAEVITAGTTNTTDIQIANVTQAADMLSTKITIDTAETGSDTAATPPVIDTANDDVAVNDVLRVDVDAVSTTPANGLLVTLEFRLP